MRSSTAPATPSPSPTSGRSTAPTSTATGSTPCSSPTATRSRSASTGWSSSPGTRPTDAGMATESSTLGASAADGARMNIGEVLELLREDFPSISIPKIRFLEEKGLVTPERTPAGYRKFSHADVERLRYTLRLQRDHHQPLARILEILDAIDRGLEPPPLVDLS